MDKYILLITDNSSEKEKEFVVNYLNNISSNLRKLFCSPFIKGAEPFTAHHSVFAASLIISDSKDCQGWQRVLGPFNELDLFKRDEAESSITLQVTEESIIRSANVLHRLADQLPSNGTYHLDVLISHKFIAHNNQCCNVYFIGALHRLCTWHSAKVSVLLTDGDEAESLQCYSKILNAEILPVPDERDNFPLLWRGVLDFGTSNGKQELRYARTDQWELRLFPGSNQNNIFLHQDLNMLYGSSNCKDNVFQLSENIEVLDECSITSIPLHMFAVPTMRLYKNGEQDQNYLIRYLTSKPGVALIMRLRYNKRKKSHSWKNLLTTEKWKASIASADLKGTSVQLDRSSDHFTFAVTAVTDHKRDCRISVFLLRSPAVGALPIDINGSDTSVPKVLDSTLLCKIPNLDHDLLGNKVGGYERQKEQFLQLLDLDKTDDSWDWPERRYLLQKQIEEDKHLRNVILDMPASQFPLINPGEVGKFFKLSGESKDVDNLDIIQPKFGLCRDLHTFEALNRTAWPDLLNIKFHDVYYSLDADEEVNYNEIKSKYLVHETASMWSLRVNAHQRTFSAHSSSSSLLDTATMKENNSILMAPTQLQSAGDILKRVQSASPFSPSIRENREKNERLSKKDSGRLVKRPNKRAGSKLERKSARIMEFPTDSYELGERHKMKLREAVVCALEKCKIGFEHELFKPCAKKLFAVCKPFVMDVVGKGETSARLKKIAESHVKQVVSFEKHKL